MPKVHFFICRHCGNIIGLVHSSGVPVACCGENMHELVPNTVEASTEKHIPMVTVTGTEVRVKIGEVEHPMQPEHYIQWVYIETTHGGQRKALEPGNAPEAVFALADGDKALAAYAYCNIHGLWKTQHFND